MAICYTALLLYSEAVKNEKFMQGYECGRVCSDYLSQYGQEEFENNLEAFRYFTDLMRGGLPNELRILLRKLCNKDEDSNRFQDENNLQVETEPVVTIPSPAPLPPLPGWLRRLPQDHQDKMSIPMAIFPVKGDGACLAITVAAFWFEDPNRGVELRRMANKWMVTTLWYWQTMLPVPYTVKVGTGEASRVVTLDSIPATPNTVTI